MAVGRTPQLVVPVNTMEVRITTNTLLVMALVETMLPEPILETHKPCAWQNKGSNPHKTSTNHRQPCIMGMKGLRKQGGAGRCATGLGKGFVIRCSPSRRCWWGLGLAGASPPLGN